MEVPSKVVRQFVIMPGRDQRHTLIAFLSGVKNLISFNGISFDTPILRYIQQRDTARQLNEELYALGQRLIDDNERNADDLKTLRYPRKRDWQQIDLMKIKSYDALGVGLKQVAINLRWPRIQELPYDYDHEIEADEVDVVLEYNLNDTQITHALYQHMQAEIELRQQIGAAYKVDVLSASDSKIANVILEHEMGDQVVDLRDKRTIRHEIALADCVPPELEFQTPEMRRLLSQIKGITVEQYKGATINLYTGKTFKIEHNFDGINYVLGVGGLHSADQPAKFVSDDRYLIRDADVSSYYPSIILNRHLRPAHLDETFDQVFRRMVQDRLSAKHSGDAVRAAALKITINSIFGKTNSNTFWLQDLLVFLSVTLSGQLYLLRLIEMLSLAGIQTISANTDGVTCRIERSQIADYERICQEWQAETRFELEFSDYDLLARRDVNNYLVKKANGQKEKGCFEEAVSLSRGYKYPIVPLALRRYFIDGIPVQETIEACTDILDFCISQKVGGQFEPQYHTVRGMETLQKHNRFFISKRGGALSKLNRTTGQTTGQYVGQWVRLLNTYDPETVYAEYEVDTDFYIRAASQIVAQIAPVSTQRVLF
jgi:Suoliviridae DNA polymerase